MLNNINNNMATMNTLDIGTLVLGQTCHNVQIDTIHMFYSSEMLLVPEQKAMENYYPYTFPIYASLI